LVAETAAVEGVHVVVAVKDHVNDHAYDNGPAKGAGQDIADTSLTSSQAGRQWSEALFGFLVQI
jgi:hypothetical protein